MPGHKYVYEFSEGSREMRELLGGKAWRRRDDTNPRPGASAGGIHDHDRGVRRVHERRSRISGRSSGADRRGARPAGTARGPPPRRRRRSTARLRALGARESMPGMLDTVLNLGLGDQSVEGLPAPPATNGSRGTPTGASCSVRQRRARRAGRAPASGDRGGQVRPRGASRHRTDHRRTARAGRALQAPARRAPASRFRRTRALSSMPRCGPCSTRGEASGRPLTGGSTGSPTTGALRSTCSRWCSVTRATPRARGSPSRATRSPVRPSRRGTS